MNDTDGRTHQMLVRSREAFAQCVNDFSEGGAARQFYADLQAAVIEVEQEAAAYGTGRSDAKQGTQTINEARETLLADLFSMREASKVMGVEDKFPYPPRNNDEQLLQMAGVYATNALPIKAQLIAHELPADFLEDLAAHKAAFQSKSAERLNAVGDHIAARQKLDDALGRGVEKVRDLTSLMKVKYANNAGKLAEWTAATHIERPPKRAKPKPPVSGTGPTPAPSSP
ncbi:MAG: hypothetical protein QOH71_3905 [Blastocatellia bacterium]|jgi:hypothetical protein|nr:hypothetical protein [Blastocatellia bacterium]